MPIEQLLHPIINARDFQPPVEAKQKSLRKQYEELKQTSLYKTTILEWDSERSMHVEKERDDERSITRDQLLDVHVERLFDQERAKMRYDALKRTSLYDQKKQLWIHYEQTENPLFATGDQLIGMVVEQVYDPENAKEKYEILKQSKAYDRENNRWNRWLNIESDVPRVSDQLLGIATEGLFDKKQARIHFNELKTPPLYTDGKWETTTEFGALDRHSYLVFNQLLGVLNEGLFNQQKAKEKYETLKKTDLYDSKQNQWYFSLYKDGKVLPGLSLYDQLLGIILEDTYDQTKFTPEKGAPVPEIRVF